MTTIAEQLKRLRIEKQLSQDALAEQLHISRQSISKWENGDATPDLDHIILLSSIFGVSLDYLVLGKKTEKTIERVVEKEVVDIPSLIKRFWIIFGNVLLAIFLLLLFYGLLDSLGLLPL